MFIRSRFRYAIVFILSFFVLGAEAGTISKEKKMDIIQMYLPMVVFWDDEPSMPISVLDYMEFVEPVLYQAPGELMAKWTALKNPYMPGSVMGPYKYDASGKLAIYPVKKLPRFNDPNSYNMLRGRLEKNPPVYAFWANKKFNGKVYYEITYFYFFPLNIGKVIHVPPFVKGTFGNHLGDWEHVSIRLDSQLRPINMYAASHDSGQKVDWSKASKLDADTLTKAVRQVGNEILKATETGKPLLNAQVGTDPMVYSAWGSHGMYLTKSGGKDPNRHVYQKYMDLELADNIPWDAFLRQSFFFPYNNIKMFDVHFDQSDNVKVTDITSNDELLHFYLAGTADGKIHHKRAVYRWGNASAGQAIDVGKWMRPAVNKIFHEQENGPTGPLFKTFMQSQYNWEG